MMYNSPKPPFNFLGHFSESQYQTFQAWIAPHTASLSQVSVYHQIRSQQLRKMAGALEQYYAKYHEESLAPTFVKAPWTPGPEGHFNYENRDDHEPMLAMSGIKKVLKAPLQRQDDGIFYMNHVRRVVENEDDLAQQAVEGQTIVTAHVSELNTYFDRPEYEAALVKDLSDTYEGSPRFRVNQLDPPTSWEQAITRRTMES